MQIAIDGPAGAGKSTVAKLVAANLGYVYIDTGAMYRALTYKVLQEQIDPADEELVYAVLGTMELKLAPMSTDESMCRVLLGSEDITEQIRQPIVTKHVSLVASHSKVREAMVDLQRQLGQSGDVVMDGRDIGTTVLPNAEIKFFLQASVEERAKRRLAELERQGHSITLPDLIEQIKERDYNDSTRKVSPLRKADDAYDIDTTLLSIREVVDIILCLVARRGACV